MTAPIAVVIVAGLLVTFIGHAQVVQLDRQLTTAGSDANAKPGQFWMQERLAPVHYILEAGYVHPGGEALGNVTVFMQDPPRERIEAEAALLEGGEWHFPTATQFLANRTPEQVSDLRLPTSTSPGDMRAKLSSVANMTIYEMAGSMASRINDPEERARVFTRFMRLIGLPLTLVGSLVIAFAFTAGYRRTNKYGGMVLYGIVLGFVVYVVTEMAGRAGDAGVIQPVLAALGPGVVAIVAGATVLLNREDGQT